MEETKQIEIWCQNCSKHHTVEKTWEIPKSAKRLGCNFCIDCEDQMTEYYHEWIVMNRARCSQTNKFQKRRFTGQYKILFGDEG